MKIGELVKKTGASKDTIRYYEKFGLLKNISRPSPFNNYKDYPEENVKRISFIKEAKQFGLTLNEIKEIMIAIENDSLNDEIVSRFLSTKIAEVSNQIQHLQHIKKVLAAALTHSCKDQPANPLK